MLNNVISIGKLLSLVHIRILINTCMYLKKAVWIRGYGYVRVYYNIIFTSLKFNNIKYSKDKDAPIFKNLLQ